MTGELHISDEVTAALAADGPVVALETTIVAHGLPRPGNLRVAREVEQIVRDAGAVPATVGVVDGRPTVGLTDEALEHLAGAEAVEKLGVRDLPAAVAQGVDGATTVAATAHLAALAGIRVLATGGLGGVHRGARETWDVSADLSTLATTDMVVVSAGVKSVLDVAATLERLETLGVPLLGYRTDEMPGFYLRSTGLRLDWRADTPEEVAAIAGRRRPLGLAGRALLVLNPLPESEALDAGEHDRLLDAALRDAERNGVRGKAATPHLLSYLHDASGGRTVSVNEAVIRGNVALAASVAVALTRI